jgi:hypothetical protein
LGPTTHFQNTLEVEDKRERLNVLRKIVGLIENWEYLIEDQMLKNDKRNL